MKAEKVFSVARKSTIRKERSKVMHMYIEKESRTRLPSDTSPFAHDGSQICSMLCPCNSSLTTLESQWKLRRLSETLYLNSSWRFACDWGRSIARELRKG